MLTKKLFRKIDTVWCTKVITQLNILKGQDTLCSQKEIKKDLKTFKTDTTYVKYKGDLFSWSVQN